MSWIIKLIAGIWISSGILYTLIFLFSRKDAPEEIKDLV
jgi:hypothetical protein